VGTILSSGMAAQALADQDAPTKTPIKHIVVIFQENISFDHYFGTYPIATNPTGEPRFVARDDTPSVNGLSARLLTDNPNLKQPIRLDRTEAFSCDEDHGYSDEQKAADGGLQDKYLQATSRLGIGCKPDGSTVMGYYDGNTVTALWNYAQHFAMNDNSFNTVFGPSTPGAINLISGQTHGATAIKAGVALTATSGAVFVDPSTGTGTNYSDADAFLDDCGADKGGTVATATTIQMSGPNIGDLLDTKGITWGWFQGGFAPTQPAVLYPDGSTKAPAVCGLMHTGHLGVPNPTAADGNPSNVDVHVAITDYSSHHAPFMYYPQSRNTHHLPPTSVKMIGRADQAKHQYDLSNFFAALKAHNMPAVSYIKAPSFEDGHPGNSDPLTEQRFLVQLINTLQQSPEWAETAVVINYDDSDGWYDHVTGPIVSPSATSLDFLGGPGNCGTPATGAFAARCGYGPRLPLLVISPWAKANFVDHATTDQSSSLRFIEDNWGVGQIDGPNAPPAGQASFDRIAGSIEGMFDFHGKPNMARLILDPDTGARQ
jgi:phospholipase C